MLLLSVLLAGRQDGELTYRISTLRCEAMYLPRKSNRQLHDGQLHEFNPKVEGKGTLRWRKELNPKPKLSSRFYDDWVAQHSSCKVACSLAFALRE